jgi:hypothetical protein
MEKPGIIFLTAFSTLLTFGSARAQCSGVNYWLNMPIAAGTKDAQGILLGTDSVTVHSQGSFASGRPGYNSNTSLYGGHTFGSLGLFRGSSFAVGTLTWFKLKTALDSNYVHIRVSDIRGDAFNAEPQRVQGFLNGVGVSATFTDPVNGAYITSGNVINGSPGTTSTVQSAMRALFNGPVDSIVVTATNLSDYVIIELEARCDIVLPAARWALKATAQQGANLLDWSGTPPDALSLVVLRSRDGRTWAPVADLPGGDATLAGPTRYRDDPAPPGRSFYRLEWQGRDGRTSLTNIVSADQPEAGAARRWKAGPNPFRDELNLYSDQPIRQMTCFRSDGSLQPLSSLSYVSGHTLLHTSHWPAGTYFLVARYADGSTETLRCIRQ